MKQSMLMLLVVTLTTTSIAQSEKYVSAMQPKISVLDTTRDGAVLLDLSNAFERIATAEKSQWLPYYYAALAQVDYGYSKIDPNGMGGDAAVIDPIADKAEMILNEAEKLRANNSEIFVVRKMIASLRMLVDPQNRYMTYGPAATEALETAKRLNPDNPRVYLLEAQDKYYTPEQYGGSKEEAKTLFQTAMQKYEVFKPENALAPAWGSKTVQYFLSLYK
jgi:hypothetical protein